MAPGARERADGRGLSRREVLRAGGGLALAAIGLSGGCGSRRDGREVVLYCSMDGQVLAPLLGRFEEATGRRVLLVGDTEATKTTGLVQRIIAERDRPRADVFWSSEPLGPVRLARAGLLEPRVSAPAESRVAGGWPGGMRAVDGSWYALAPRARVVVVNTREAPGATMTNLDGLTAERFKGRVGMARPQFGTTRAHVAALLAVHGPERYGDWLVRLRDNGLRLYDGNGAVVRACARSEIHVGLTDNDDVASGVANGWPVGQLTPHSHLQPWHYRLGEPMEWPFGSMRVPGMVGIVRGGPNPVGAAALMDAILSADVERELAAGVWGSMPVDPAAAAAHPLARVTSAPDFGSLADHEARALEIFDRVMAGGGA